MFLELLNKFYKKSFLRRTLIIFFLFISYLSYNQVFEDLSYKKDIKNGVEYIYNAQFDSANLFIERVSLELPNHPVVPLMRAMNILWSHIPLIGDSLFLEMEHYLNQSIEMSKKLDPKLEDPEFIYFSLAAYGLLAEYYAEKDYYIKAAGAANRAYGLLKKGFELVDQNPEFLFTTGLYNYFREKYPEKYPVYKPFLWFFRKGDMEKGLKQLERSTRLSFFSQVEAKVYLSYIYLRYEYEPSIAQRFLRSLCDQFPNNLYALAKYMESIAQPDNFNLVDINEIQLLIDNPSPYFQLAGYVFKGYYFEIIKQDYETANLNYSKGLEQGKLIPENGEFFKSFGNLGKGRVLLMMNEKPQAEESFRQAIRYAETEQIKEEAKDYLSKF